MAAAAKATRARGDEYVSVDTLLGAVLEAADVAAALTESGEK